MRLAQASVQCDPGIDLDLIFDVGSDEAPVGILRQWRYRATAVVEDHMEKLIVLLSETVEACSRIATSRDPRHGTLATFVFGRAVLRRSTRKIIWVAYVVDAVVMEKG